MHGRHLSGEAFLVGDKLKFECTVENRPTVVVDYVPPAGDGEGIMSLELLLLSLATCFGSAIKVLVSSNPRRHVQSLHVKVEGERRETHPTVFESISLHVAIAAIGLDSATLDALVAKAEQICPVYAMLRTGVPISLDCQLTPSMSPEARTA